MENGPLGFNGIIALALSERTNHVDQNDMPMRAAAEYAKKVLADLDATNEPEAVNEE